MSEHDVTVRSNSIQELGGLLPAYMLEGLTEGGTEVELQGRDGFGKPGGGRGALITVGLEQATDSLQGMDRVRVIIFGTIVYVPDHCRDIIIEAGRVINHRSNHWFY
jgi:hypothetical protein